MADVRLLIQEEGRAARNLIAFNVPVGTNNTEKVTRKPPSVPRVSQANATKRCMKPTTRVRSASTGRDKKSGELKLFDATSTGNDNKVLYLYFKSTLVQSSFLNVFVIAGYK